MTDSLRDDLRASLGSAYDIQRELGGGGMSRVFLATDAMLGREVVVKVLPPDAGAALSVERFKREVALAAKLQHPHIVPLLTAGATASGLPFYMMPFVDGESLQARIAREGELPVSDTVAILREVVRALAYAHARGIVHRDIKPDNVMLSGGSAMVTDFGVAKAVNAAASGDAGATLTAIGVALGTPAYMSPEQAAAEPNVDHRADLYAVGCMAYEMLTGQPPFVGRNASATIAAQVAETPEPVQRRRPSVPPTLAAIVMHCLEKRPADRPRDATELVRALDAVVPTPPGTLSASTVPRRHATLWRRARPTFPWLFAAAGLAVGLTAAAKRSNAPATPPLRFALDLDGREAVAWVFGGQPLALSPDGRTLAYIGAQELSGRLFVRSLNELQPREIAGTADARNPIFSPDGRWIAFQSRDRIRRVSVDGGSVTDVTDSTVAVQGSGSVWTADDEIIFSMEPGGGARGSRLFRVPARGGAALPLTTLDTGRRELSHQAPRLQPDGRSLIFTVVTRKAGGVELGLASLRAGAGRHTMLNVAAPYAVGVAKDRLFYARDDRALMAIAFDARRERVRGAPVPTGDSGTYASLARNGTLLYVAGSRRSTVVLVDDHGIAQPLIAEPRGYGSPRFSPDGKRIVVDIGGNVWIYELASQTLTRLTSGQGYRARAEWSPDGTRVLYQATGMGIWWQPADGSGKPEKLIEIPNAGPNEGMISPTGRYLAYRTDDGRGNQDIGILSLDGSNAQRAFALGPLHWSPRFSPDERWLAYSSAESGQSEVYVKPFPGPGGRVQISTGNAVEPMWSRDGRTLFYRTGATLVAAMVSTTPTLAVTKRTVLFEGNFVPGGAHTGYDVAPDGKHFLMLKPSANQPHVVIALNWAADAGSHRVPGSR